MNAGRYYAHGSISHLKAYSNRMLEYRRAEYYSTVGQ
jgi:hypothetical protein